MAEWNGTARTNYFQVTDEAKFREWAEARALYVIAKDAGGAAFFGVYSETDDGGWPTNSWPDDEDVPIEIDVVAELAAHLAEGQIAVLMESGHEKCRYVDGNAVAVDHAGNRVAIELRDIYDLAAKTFGIPVEQITECAY